MMAAGKGDTRMAEAIVAIGADVCVKANNG